MIGGAAATTVRAGRNCAASSAPLPPIDDPSVVMRLPCPTPAAIIAQACANSGVCQKWFCSATKPT